MRGRFTLLLSFPLPSLYHALLVKDMFALPWLPHVSLLHTISFLCSEANAIACCVSGLPGVLPSYSDEEKVNFLCCGCLASNDFPLSHIDGETDGQM